MNQPIRETVALVLAGGRSVRLGKDKALLSIDGESFLARTIRVTQCVADETLVVGRDQLPPAAPQVRAVADEFQGVGPLGGLLTGLVAAPARKVVLVACDLPLLRVELLSHLLSVLNGHDAVVPLVHGRLQPLCAVYSGSIGEKLRQQIQSDNLSFGALLEHLDVLQVDESIARMVDPDLASFVNINSPNDLHQMSRESEPLHAHDCRARNSGHE